MLVDTILKYDFNFHCGRLQTAQSHRKLFVFPQYSRCLLTLQKVDKLFFGGFYLKIFPRWLSKLLLKTGIIHLMAGYYQWSSKSVSQVLDSITDNKKLKAVLAYNFGDYGE